MKLKDADKTIDDNWIKKPTGFRVRYQVLENGTLVTQCTPEKDQKPFDSDVTAWRYAWKLWQATGSDDSDIALNELVNIHVVDDDETPIPYYATGKPEIFNPKTLNKSV